MALNPQLQEIFDLYHLTPIWDTNERVLDWEHLWNLITQQQLAATDALIDYIGDLENSFLKATHPVGGKLFLATDDNPNVFWADSGMVWTKDPPGTLIYTAQTDDEDADWYVGDNIHPEGNLRTVPVAYHNHGEFKHGHLNATFSAVLATGNLYTNNATEYNLPAYIVNGVMHATGSSTGIPQSFDFNPRTPTSSQIFIGTEPPVAIPPNATYQTYTENPAPGNIDFDAKGGMPLQGDAAGATSKFPYKTPDNSAERGLETKYAGEVDANIDVTPMGKCVVVWTRVA